MIKLYCDKDLIDGLKQKKRVLTPFLISAVLYLAVCVVAMIFYASLPYASPLGAVPKIAVYSLTALFVIFWMPYLSIKYHRVKKYCKVLYYISEGLKVSGEDYFDRFSRVEMQKDNVDVNGCVFLTWDKKHSEWREREIYLDVEKEFPKFESGDLVRYVTQSNFLIEYEIIKKNAFSEEKAKKE